MKAVYVCKEVIHLLNSHSYRYVCVCVVCVNDSLIFFILAILKRTNVYADCVKSFDFEIGRNELSRKNELFCHC